MRPRSVALITRDPVLYSELAGFLRERRLPSVSLLPGQRIPDRVAVVLTSRAEAASISHPNVLAVAEDGDRRALSAAVSHALEPGRSEEELVVGLDPGPRPGYAILSGRRCLGEGVLESPEAAGPFAVHLRRQFPSRHVVFRVGSGDPPRRNRLVNELLAHHRWVELVDEQGTTPRGHRRPRDPAAARSIAAGLGREVRAALPTTFTPGEVANLQRLSREGSGGLVTIPRASAHRVLRGEISLADAVAETIARRGPGGPTAGRAAEARSRGERL
ncbi:MAG TPA: hypothetical protein VEL82_01345 [Thermoplasmata archaeon]|nr:hypothetical protein [Thermoplasmata archaeon]